jgi:hypothetical protein
MNDIILTQQAIINLLACDCVLNDLTIVSPTDAVRPSDSAIEAEKVRITNETNWASLRQQRNRLISETDYLALADATLTDEMSTYRQTLRDLPANTTDPANPVWPTKPGA